MTRLQPERPWIPWTTAPALLSVFLHLGFAATAEAAWEYGYRKLITIDSSKVTADLSNFPVLISLSSDMDLRTTADGGHVENANGYDIIFRATDNTKLDFEVEKYTSAAGGATLIAWVNIPNLSSTVDTDIYIYYGNPNVSCSQENAAGVWDPNYEGIWHLREDPSGAAPQMADSTQNKNDGTTGGAMTSTDQVTGIIDGSLDFDAVNDYINAGDDPSLHMTQATSMTFSAWVRTRTGGNVQNLIRYDDCDDADGDTTCASRNLWMVRLETNRLELTYGPSASLSQIFSSPSITTNTWYHVVAVRDVAADSERVYINGILDNSETDTTTGTWETTGQFAMIGRFNRAPDIEFFDGFLDELRVSSVARSAAWIQTEFNNQSLPTRNPACSDGGFACIGSEQTGPYQFPWIYGYRKKLTIDSTKVTCGSDVSDFPALISLVDPDLRSRANGGHVESVNGYDVVFRASDGSTNLDFERESYNGSAGTLVAWVRVPTVSTSVDTDIYMYYGNPEVACSNQTANPTGVWDANYAGIWHLREDPSSSAPQVRDSTSNANHGTTQGAMTASDQIPGRINGSLDLDGVDDYVAVPDANSLDIASSFTIEAWARWSSVSSNGYILEKGGAGGFENNYYLWWNNNTVIMPNTSVAAGYSTGTAFRDVFYDSTPTVGQWYHVVTVFDDPANQLRIYVDGVQVASNAAAGSPGIDTGELRFGRDSKGVWGGDVWWDGTLDEIRVSRSARSACWIETEYNSQSNPTKNASCSDGGFVCVGAEEAGPPTAVELASLTATGLDREVVLEWATASELKNLGFHVYRGPSADGPWERLTANLIPGLGSSPQGARYVYRDSSLSNGTTYYYLLEDVETTGRMERHGPVEGTPNAQASVIDPTLPPAATTYGDPEATLFRVLSRGASETRFELTTGGFYAFPQEDGTVEIEVPGFTPSKESPGLPVKLHWLEAVAGRKVEIISVRATGVQALGLVPSGSASSEIEASWDGTQRLRRARTSRASFRSTALSPNEAARIGEVAFQGDVKKALLELAPLRWDGATGRLLFARKLQVTLSFRNREPSETATASGRRGRRERETAASRGIVARLATVEPGLHRVRYEDVFRETRGRGVDAGALRLSRLGNAVAFHLEPPTDRFAPGSTLFFLSEGPDANPYGNEAVYELETGRAGERMRTESAAPKGMPIHELQASIEREEDRYYQAALLEAPDLWLWDMLLAPSVKVFPFAVSSLASSSRNGKLEVWLQGASDFPESPDHHARLFVNGTYVGDEEWNGKEPRRIEIGLPSGILREGENSFEVESLQDTGALYSMFFLDRFSVTYPQLPVVASGIVSGTWDESGTAEVSAIGGSARVLDVTGTAPRWLTGARYEAGSLRFHVEAGRSYLAVDPASVKRPEVRKATPARWKKDPPRADYIAIGPRDLLDAAQPLLDHRRGQGLAVASVPIDEVFDEMGYGEKRPEALRDFLTYAYHHWPGGIRYVLLLGDASYDFKDHLGTGAPNRVPALPIKTSYLWTASDPTLAAVNGDDLLPDVAIGRLPAADASELRAMIDKILAYEAGESGLATPVVLVTDNPDVAGDFDTDALDLMTSVLASRPVRHISLGALGAERTRESILEAFDEGPSVVSYIGHGGIHLWASENIFNNDSVALLAPHGPQPIVNALDCLNGYFHFPFFDSLAEELLKADAKGAVAVFAPSGLSLNEPAHELHKALLRELFEGEHTRLGDAVLAAQAKFLDTGSFSELLAIYHLFGDPALQLK